jgi:hypothetical protein
MPTAPDATAPSNAALRISLKIVQGAAVVDAVFLVGLLVALAAGSAGAVRVLGALYGFGFVYLLYLAAKGAMDRRWGWSYLLLVAVTLGPVGALLGARRMQAAPPETTPGAPDTPAARSTRKEERKAATERRRAGR